jgi:hypothetical protein
VDEKSAIEEFQARLSRLPDEAAITKVLLTYGLATDAGLASLAGDLWLEDGACDWDAEAAPHCGSAGVEAMLASREHRGLIAKRVANFGGPPLIELAGDRPTALSYSLIMRREEGRSYLWRVSAVRWDLEREDERWRVRRWTNRLLDPSGVGSQLLADSLRAMTEDA